MILDDRERPKRTLAEKMCLTATYCKMRYVSKFTAASHGSPCDSTAFLSIFVSAGVILHYIQYILSEK